MLYAELAGMDSGEQVGAVCVHVNRLGSNLVLNGFMDIELTGGAPANALDLLMNRITLTWVFLGEHGLA